ncbi:helix-turn-helix domain-containing protein [Wielerella bovis]|uniref:helix-turn-helix domain-containing protein n=1 Tax=Wielerella bovis TaxID=2917790 RepID=UPI0020187518|nr:helix-turn-helix domain-containing protein [Wielerella bovis]MCG7655902.1 helix-turn-helix domain-containing protein [Wielerella bovis]MCG7656899.1 helix-turn-helix domain-containing protein [Wielerella bovis]MCG7658092.1 helix-turn-helix domain-containing protein [Wielerella bovis]MCG7658180.1 helix-turn-helix domain-containing protein [Wielerella bovis]MCG7659122.1 helix-turn-helix domain-containing protein [Wielerella bovis]
MHPELIKAKLRMSGYTLADVARETDTDASAVRLALRKPSLSGEKAIAQIIKLPLHELFPDRWTKDGKRIRPRYRYLYEEVAA